jgi:predicted HicB family RNase H-like nuclease
MAKKDDIAKDLARGRRNIKKPITSTEEAEKVIKKVHSPKKEEETIRTTLDLPKYIHKAIKLKAAEEEISLKDYIINLVKVDLNLE